MKYKNYTPEKQESSFSVSNSSGYNPYRDWKSGEFTDAPFSTSMTSGSSNRSAIDQAQIDQQNITKMFKAAQDGGGMTISVHGDTPSEGIAFAPSKSSEVIISNDNFTKESLAEFVNDNFDTLSQEGMHVGGWLNSEDNNWYLDISKVGSYGADTIREAQAAEQLAVFDLKTFNETQIGRIENGKYEPIGSPEAIYDEAFRG